VSSEIVVIVIENGEVRKIEKKSGELEDVVKDIARKELEEWDVTSSDFVVLRDSYSLTLPLPLTKEQYEKLHKYGIKRRGNVAEVDLPIFEISREISFEGEEGPSAGRVIVVAPYVNDDVTRDIANQVTEALKGVEESSQDVEE